MIRQFKGKILLFKSNFQRATVSKTKQNIYDCTVKVIYCYEYVLFINHFYKILQFFCHKSLHCNTIAIQGVNILLLGRRFCMDRCLCVINLHNLVGRVDLFNFTNAIKRRILLRRCFYIYFFHMQII